MLTTVRGCNWQDLWWKISLVNPQDTVLWYAAAACKRPYSWSANRQGFEVWRPKEALAVSQSPITELSFLLSQRGNICPMENWHWRLELSEIISNCLWRHFSAVLIWEPIMRHNTLITHNTLRKPRIIGSYFKKGYCKECISKVHKKL